MVLTKGSNKADSNNNNRHRVRVVARIRPLSKQEEATANNTRDKWLRPLQGKTADTALVQVDGGPSSSNNNNKRWYELDAVLDEQSSQADVYQRSGAHRAVTVDLFEGYNASILAYGQTGSGKTFTMGTADAASVETMGSNNTNTNCSTLPEMAGIIPRACVGLFESIEQKCVNGKATVTLTYLELYNEQIRDLLLNDDQQSQKGPKKNTIRIREGGPNGTVQVQGCVEQVVQSPTEIGQLMQTASQRRVVAATAMNATSSRSHAICTLTIRGSLKGGDGENDETAAKKIVSKLTLVDLAGSERIKKTGAEGARQTEGININKSLLVLGQVVSALSKQGSSSGRKPPYRDSKLTRLLQDVVGGNSKCIMVACVSPAQSSLDETNNTLRYAANARRITNHTRQNLASMVPATTNEQAFALRQENSRLQKENQELQVLVENLRQQLQQNEQNEDEAAILKRTVNSATATSSTVSTSFDEMDSQISTPDNTKGLVPDQIRFSSSSNSMVAPLLSEAKVSEQNQQSSNAFPSGIDYEARALTYKMEIAQLKEQLDSFDLMETRNQELLRELEEAKLEAESATAAASYLSDIVDELRDIKHADIEKKRLKLEMAVKEQSWISFVQMILENIRMNTSELSTIFDATVVRKIEKLRMLSKIDVADRDCVTGNLPKSSRRQSIHNINLHVQTEQPSQGDLLRMAVNKPKQKFFSIGHAFLPSTHSIWGGGGTKDATEKDTRWKECAEQFCKEILRVERMIQAEAESMKSVQSQVANQCRLLELEVGAEKAITNSMFSSSSSPHELVDHLSAMLLHRQNHEGATAVVVTSTAD